MLFVRCSRTTELYGADGADQGQETFDYEPPEARLGLVALLQFNCFLCTDALNFFMIYRGTSFRISIQKLETK